MNLIDDGIRWRVRYQTTDGDWHYDMVQLGIIVEMVYDNLASAQYEAKNLVTKGFREWKDVVKVEISEERVIVSILGPSQKPVER